jgi:hypothetical protein
MAYASVATSSTGTVTSNATAWTLTYPTSVAANDLLLAFVATDGVTTATWPTGWIKAATITDSGNSTTLHVAKKNGATTDTGNFTVTMSATEQGGWRIFRITGWKATIGTTFDNTTNSGSVEFGGTATGASTSSDSGSLNPANWDTEETLWFSAIAVDTTPSVSTFPTGAGTTYAMTASSATSAGLGVASFNEYAASKDPGAFTISSSDDWAAATVAVRPNISNFYAYPDLIGSTVSLFAPRANMSFSPGLIPSQVSLFSPKANQSLSFGLISNLASAASPQVNLAVSAPLLTNEAQVFQFRLVERIDNVFATPLVTGGEGAIEPSVAQAVNAQRIERTFAIYAPSSYHMIPGSATIQVLKPLYALNNQSSATATSSVERSAIARATHGGL